MITPTEIKQNEQIRTYIEKADEALAALGYTEHSYAHVTRVAHFAEKIMADLGYPRRMQELAWIAGYMHDIGNVINRIDHAQSGAVMAFRILDKLGIDYEMTIISAHREPDVFFDWAKSAEDKGFKVIIAGAGKAAHLPGMCAAIFPMPVIGIPMKTSDLGGVDSLYSIVQMPSGIPVATVAINGGANAGILAAKILATSDAELLAKLKEYSESLKNDVVKKAGKLEQVGYKEYLAQMK